MPSSQNEHNNLSDEQIAAIYRRAINQMQPSLNMEAELAKIEEKVQHKRRMRKRWIMAVACIGCCAIVGTVLLVHSLSVSAPVSLELAQSTAGTATAQHVTKMDGDKVSGGNVVGFGEQNPEDMSQGNPSSEKSFLVVRGTVTDMELLSMSFPYVRGQNVDMTTYRLTVTLSEIVKTRNGCDYAAGDTLRMIVGMDAPARENNRVLLETRIGTEGVFPVMPLQQGYYSATGNTDVFYPTDVADVWCSYAQRALIQTADGVVYQHSIYEFEEEPQTLEQTYGAFR